MYEQNVEEKALKRALAYKPWAKQKLEELEAEAQEGKKPSLSVIVQLKAATTKSIDELKKDFINKFYLKGSCEITNEEFTNVATIIGTAPTSSEALDVIFENRESEYLKYYKVDSSDPGLIYIIRQIIQDEMQVTRLRQNLAEIATKPNQDSGDKDDLSRKIIDSINKINKSIFEFTKFLKLEKDDVEKKVQEEKDKKDRESKFGLRIKDFQENKNDNPKIKKAAIVQKRKANQYVQENLGDADG